jgi:DNA replication protein DnaC
MKTANDILLLQNLKTLKLSTMADALAAHLRQAREGHQEYDEFLLALTDVELAVRTEHRLKRRLREAKFPLLKPLEAFQVDRATGLDVRLLKELSHGDYITQHRNIILLGKSGTGKTHLATGFGIAACHQGFRTRFVTGCGLTNELLEARDDHQVSRTIKRYAGYDLLIVDELGYVPFSKAGAELLFQVLAERHERRSVILTTNLGFADWTQMFGEATLTAALLDRVTHQAHIINCTWESYRLQETLRRSASTNSSPPSKAPRETASERQKP